MEPPGGAPIRPSHLHSQPSRSSALSPAARFALRRASSAEETPARAWLRSRPPKVATTTGARVFLRCWYHLRPSGEHQPSPSAYTGSARPGVPIPKWSPDQTWTVAHRASVQSQPAKACRSITDQPPALRPPPPAQTPRTVTSPFPASHAGPILWPESIPNGSSLVLTKSVDKFRRR